jgi:hypothetical protein
MQAHLKHYIAISNAEFETAKSKYLFRKDLMQLTVEN